MQGAPSFKARHPQDPGAALTVHCWLVLPAPQGNTVLAVLFCFSWFPSPSYNPTKIKQQQEDQHQAKRGGRRRVSTAFWPLLSTRTFLSGPRVASRGNFGFSLKPQVGGSIPPSSLSLMLSLRLSSAMPGWEPLRACCLLVWSWPRPSSFPIRCQHPTHKKA